MKKNYTKILWAIFLIFTSGQLLKAQCTTPSPPSVSGATIAGCVNSASFALTATGTGTNLLGWYANSFGGNALTTNSTFTTPTLTSGTTYYVGQSTRSSFDTLSLPTHSTILQSFQTRGFWFVSPVDFIITGLRVPIVVGGTLTAGLAVMKFPVAPPLYSASVTNTFSTLYLNQSITGTNVVAVNIPVYAGDIIGILGERGGDCSYGATTNPFLSTLGIGTTTINLNRLGMLYDLATTAPTDLWTETTNSIGRVEVYATRGCNSTLTPVTVSVVAAPQISVTPPPHVCANSAYTLSASGASTYTWSGGPQTSTYVVNPSTTTTYSVAGSILSTCNSTLSTVTISVDPSIPVLTATSSSNTICSGHTLTLNGAGAPTFTWAGGTNTVTSNVAFIPAATQQYTLYGSNSCGIGSTLITVTVNPTPIITIAASSAIICDGQTATLTANGAATYSWTNNTSPGAVTVVSPTTTSAYNIMGVSSAGCPAMNSQIIIVNPNPTVSIGAVQNKTLVCAGGSATLTSSGADTYSWTSGVITSTNLVNPTSTTVYTVTGTYTMTQCSATNAIAVTIFSPVLAVSADTTVCNGSAVTLTANAGAGTTYTWSTGSPFGSTNITATVAASYSVIALTSTINGVKCPSSATVQINIYANPTVNVVATRTAICKGEKLILTASGGTSYAWANLAPTTATIQVSPTVVNVTTTYSVTGTDANGCSKSATIGVKVNACTGIDEIEKEENVIAVYPNPNNGNFTISSKSNVDVSLINELGQVIKVLSFNEENQFQQNVQGLSNGIYFIKGIHNGISIQNKLVVSSQQ